MIIDAHVHIHRNKNAFGEKYDASYQTLLDKMEKGVIDKCVLLAIHNFIDNDFIYEVIQKYPDKFYAFGGIDPRYEPGKIEAELKQFVRYGFKGIKLHPRMQQFSINDQSVHRLFKINDEKFGFPILIDLLPYSGGVQNFSILDNMPLEYDRIAKKYLKTSFILAHFGGHLMWDAFMVAKSNSNVFLDISYILNYFEGAPILHDLGYLIKRLGCEKVIYGSDSPEIDLNQYYYKVVDFLNGIGVNKKEREVIFSLNIQKLLAVEPNG